jgi:peptidoglycan-associated lipoprotein
MRFKLLTLFAAALLVAACETAPEETAATDTSGAVETPAVQPTPAPAPSGPAPGSQEDLLLNVGDRVFFAFDRSDLNTDSRATLEKLAAWMTTNQNVTITIEGHCDERGTREYNLALGERRSDAARDYLVALGVDGGRLTTISYGKERPAVLGSNEDAWAQNRRDVFVVN